MKGVKSLMEGQEVEGLGFLCREYKVATTKNGNEYISLTLEDRSSKIEARVWDKVVVEDVKTLAENGLVGKVLSVDGQVTVFNGEQQLKISDVRLGDGNPHDFLKASRYSAEQMHSRLVSLVRSTTTAPLTEILLTCMKRAPGFAFAPASKQNHHGFVSGLLEHTSSMYRLAIAIGSHYSAYYPGLINVELVCAGVILHDIGKVWEQDILENTYTTVGGLVGHIAMGSELVSEVMAELEVDDKELEMRLKHLVLSHHGRKEWGSPVEPCTAEAIVLHFIDMLDSRMGMVSEALEELEPGNWSDWVRPLGVKLYRPKAPVRGES